jgi:hypothetical protein
MINVFHELSEQKSQEKAAKKFALKKYSNERMFLGCRCDAERKVDGNLFCIQKCTCGLMLLGDTRWCFLNEFCSEISLRIFNVSKRILRSRKL